MATGTDQTGENLIIMDLNTQWEQCSMTPGRRRHEQLAIPGYHGHDNPVISPSRWIVEYRTIRTYKKSRVDYLATNSIKLRKMYREQ